MSERTVLATEAVPLDTLNPFPHNPRVADLELIRASVRQLGQYRAIVVNRRKVAYHFPDGTVEQAMTVLAGNHLLEAMRAEGFEEALVHFVEVGEEAAKQIVAVDNRSADLGRYDDRLLAELLQSLDSLEGTGYTPEDLDDLLARAAPPDIDELVDQLGPPDPTEFWPVLRFKVSPEVRQRYLVAVESIEGGDDVQFEYLVSCAERLAAE